jgi:putative peptide zinc metalloprotease protein
MSAAMFSEAWHRVARRRARLHPNVQVERQRYRGLPWYVLRDPFNNQFFRLSASAYHFAARLREDRTIEQVWRECLELFPDEAPGQQEVIKLLAQLTQANLISSDLPPDTAMMAERRRQKEEKELQGKLVNFLFLRFSLLDPTPLLDRLLPAFRLVFNRWGAAAWALLVLAAGKIALENWDALHSQSEGLLSPSNLFLLYACGIGAKFWHELGHGLVCRFFGGEVRSLGVMMVILTPMPFVDASSSWGFPNKWHRILVACAGMIFEFFLASLAALVWANTGAGLANAVAYNLMVVASVTTFLFNINPLLRFDGYYILSDLGEIPNLAQRATAQIRFLLEKHVYKCRLAVPVAQAPSEAAWLAVYGVAAGLYRVVLLGSIALVVADHFFGLGIVLAALSLGLWVVMPVGKFFRYLFTDPVLEATRSRVLGVTLGTLAVLVLLFAVIPFPRHVRAEGVVEASRFNRLFARTEGRLVEILKEPGTRVKEGEPLARFENTALEGKKEEIQAQIRGLNASLQQAAYEANVRLEPLQSQLKSAVQALQNVEQEKKDLLLVAPFDGVWVAPELANQNGAWFPKGSPLGIFIDPSSFRFAAIVQQQQAAELFFRSIRSATVRLRGEAGREIRTENIRRIPAEQAVLPTPALGWRGGGEIEVANTDQQGVHTKEPFFLVYADLQPGSKALLAQHRRGQIRFHAGYEPLLEQGLRALRQMLQRRLKL